MWLPLNASNQALPVSKRDSSPSALSTYTSTRSLYGVVWSCIVTTFLCAWVSIHLNTLPKQPRILEKLLLRICSLLLMIFAPEIVVGWAFIEWMEVKRTVDMFKEEGFKISMIHAYLIRMGSFALCYPEAKVRESSTTEDMGLSTPKTAKGIRRAAGNASVEHDESNKAKEMARNDEKAGKSDNEQIQEGTRNDLTVAEETPNTFNGPPIISDDLLLDLRYIETLSAERFLELLSPPKPAIRFPIAALSELKDRSKTDALSKFITAVQVLWFVVQCIVRYVEGLAITQLELSTLALASLNAYMLWIWRGKPQGVDAQVPVYLLEDSVEWEKWRSEWETRKNNISNRKREEKDSTWKRLWDGLVGRRSEKHRNREEDMDKFLEDAPVFSVVLSGVVAVVMAIPLLVLFGVSFAALYPLIHFLLKSTRIRRFLEQDLNRSVFRKQSLIFLAHALYLGVAYGGLHCAGWNFTFPTTVEQILWRAMSVVITVTPFLTLVFYGSAMLPGNNTVITAYFALLLAITLVVYTIARISLLVLMLTSLRRLPETAYLAVSWAKLFPHPSS